MNGNFENRTVGLTSDSCSLETGPWLQVNIDWLWYAYFSFHLSEILDSEQLELSEDFPNFERH